MTLCSNWADVGDLCHPCTDLYDDPDIDLRIQEASELLYMLSGQQFPGECEETIIPCSYRASRQGVPNAGVYPSSSDRLRAMSLSVTCSCHTSASCTCTHVSTILLPRSPIIDVTEVTIDGDPFTDFELRGRELLRTDDEAWPCCPEDEEVTITYSYGRNPPVTGVRAAAVLACELWLSCSSDENLAGQCRLPRNISALTRQGVSVVFASLTNRRTNQPFALGLLETDVFLAAYAPYGTHPPSVITSPDIPILARKVP